jgi:hypothetical protein
MYIKRISLILLYFFIISSIYPASRPHKVHHKARPTRNWFSPLLASNKSIIIESGFSTERIIEENSITQNTLFNTTLVSLNFSDKFDIHLQADYAKVNTDGVGITGLNPLIIGSELSVLDGKGILPQTSLLVDLTLPYPGKKEFVPKNIAPSVYLLMQNDLPNNFSLTYNIGFEFDGTSTHPTTFASVGMGYDVSKKWGVFVEDFNYFNKEYDALNQFESGVNYTVNKKFQLTFSTKVNLFDFKNYYGLYAGIIYQIPL